MAALAAHVESISADVGGLRAQLVAPAHVRAAHTVSFASRDANLRSMEAGLEPTLRAHSPIPGCESTRSCRDSHGLSA